MAIFIYFLHLYIIIDAIKMLLLRKNSPLITFILKKYQSFLNLDKQLFVLKSMKMNSNKIIKVVALLAVVVFFSSCNRGGVGCPFELEAGFDVLNLLTR